MKRGLTGWPMLIWAATEVVRRPGRHLLLTACLGAMIAVAATAVLFSQALDATWRQLMDQSPDLVIRRIDSGGWRPLPAHTAVEAAGRVPGALDPTPRVWGVAAGPKGPVTVLATIGRPLPPLTRTAVRPGPGQAVVGRWVSSGLTDARLTLVGQTSLTVTVMGTFPPDSALATDDLVWLSVDDARALLGLADGQASDLAVYLFREEEQQAIQTDLTDALPWPVQITDRTTAARRHHRLAMRTGSVAVTACIPSLLALLLLVAGTVGGGNGRQAQWGLFKALGWTTGDLVKLRLAEAAIVAVPAGVLGLAAAYAAVFYPPTAGLTALWFTGGRHVPELVLSGSGVLVTMLVIGSLAVLPYAAAVFLATLREAAHDPFHLLQADPWK